MRDREYDRFGPWVTEISEADPPPPLFQPHVTDEPTLLQVKIPRKIERRDARPGMNLYDYLVSLFEDRIEILQRVQDAVKLIRISYTDIQRILHGEDLLLGTVAFATGDGRFEVPFSAVSSNLMERMVTLVRRRYVGKERPLEVGSVVARTEGVQSYYYRGLLHGMRSESPYARALAFQNETPVWRYETRVLQNFFQRVVGKRLLESLCITDGRELQILDQGRTYRYRGFPIYTRNTHYIPISRITGISWSEEDPDTAVVRLKVDVEGSSVIMSLVRDNECVLPLARVLASLPGFEDSVAQTERLVTV